MLDIQVHTRLLRVHADLDRIVDRPNYIFSEAIQYIRDSTHRLIGTRMLSRREGVGLIMRIN
jgi:hypothetical protein